MGGDEGGWGSVEALASISACCSRAFLHEHELINFLPIFNFLRSENAREVSHLLVARHSGGCALEVVERVDELGSANQLGALSEKRDNTLTTEQQTVGKRR